MPIIYLINRTFGTRLPANTSIDAGPGVATIILVRHGQASFGAADYDPLSELGHEQSRRLGERFGDAGTVFDRAVTGTLRRHSQTADACLAAAGSAPIRHQDAAFDEYDHSELLARHDARFVTPDGMRDALASEADPRRAFQRQFALAFQRWIGGTHDVDYRESFPSFRARAVAGLERLLAAASPVERLVVFTSGGPIAAILQWVLGIPDDRVASIHFSLVNASVTTIRVGGSGPHLVTLNCFQHLEHARAPGLVTHR